jgi:hypothetical protein
MAMVYIVEHSQGKTPLGIDKIGVFPIPKFPISGVMRLLVFFSLFSSW